MTRRQRIQAGLDRSAMMPRRRPQPAPPSTSPARPIDVAEAHRRWRWLHAILSQPVPVEHRPGVWASITRLADGMGCSCASHWSDLLAANPIDWDNPEQWGVDRHNDVNRHTGKRENWTVAQAHAAKTSHQ